jgi:hypothetical protein
MTPEIPQPNKAFEFSEQEELFERISHERFTSILTDERTAVHSIEVSTNNYGEFLFVTMSRPTGDDRKFLTFWGAGYHESRERWLTNEWRWYETQQFLHQIPQKIAPADAQALIQERLDEIAPYVTPHQPSKRAQLFEMLAELTDEDGAFSELEDLGEAGIDWLLGDED